MSGLGCEVVIVGVQSGGQFSGYGELAGAGEAIDVYVR